MLATMIPIESSFIRAAGYDGATLTVELHSGRIYHHPRVPYSLFEGLLNAISPGGFYNRYIRGKYR